MAWQHRSVGCWGAGVLGCWGVWVLAYSAPMAKQCYWLVQRRDSKSTPYRDAKYRTCTGWTTHAGDTYQREQGCVVTACLRPYAADNSRGGLGRGLRGQEVHGNLRSAHGPTSGLFCPPHHSTMCCMLKSAEMGAAGIFSFSFQAKQTDRSWAGREVGSLRCPANPQDQWKRDNCLQTPDSKTHLSTHILLQRILSGKIWRYRHP
ncbi:hypothetical protein V8F33_014014 [Rhypophila sp. PSN 637]